MPAIDRSILDAVKDVTKAEALDKPSTPCPLAKPPCWKDFPKDAEPYEPKSTDVQQGWGLKQNDWMNVQKQHHGNCAVQTAQLLTRFGELQFGKNNNGGYSEEEMEVLANCPKLSGYNRKDGTKPNPSRNIYENAGMITCHHAPTTANIEKALKRNYPVSTGHEVKHLWGESKGGHRVATVGYLKNAKTGKVTAYLVHDTGRGCVYYVPTKRYEESLNPGDIIIVTGRKKNCKDSNGKPVKPGACCLTAYNNRKAVLAASLAEEGTAKALTDNRSKWEEYYRKQAREARERIEMFKLANDFGHQMQLLAESLGDTASAAAWKKYCEQSKADWQKAYDRWKKAKVDLLDKQEKITPLGRGDSGADADRKSCGDAAKNMKCEEERFSCPICGK